MNQALANFLKRGIRPAYIVLATCVLLFASATSRMAFWERQAAPAIAELRALKTGEAPTRYGINSFVREYLTDPFGKAIGLSERQLQLCQQISAMVPAYESAVSWRNASLFAGLLTLLAMGYQKWGSKTGWTLEELGRNLRMSTLRLILRRIATLAEQRLSKLQQTVRQKQAPAKEAVVSNIIPCPTCRQELRVPAGKGKVRITCSACHTKFEAFT